MPLLVEPAFLVMNIIAARSIENFWVYWTLLLVLDLGQILFFWFGFPFIAAEYTYADNVNG